MKVVHLLNGKEGGGIGTAISNILPGLAELGVESRILIASRNSGLIKYFEQLGFSVDTIPKKFRGDPLLADRIAKYCRANHVDVLHTHSIASNFYGRLSRVFRPGCRVVTTVHAVTGDELQGASTSHWWKRAIRRFDLKSHKWSDSIIAVSPFLAEKLSSEGIDDSRIDVIPHGIPFRKTPATDDEISAAKLRWGFDSTDVVIGIVGRLSQVKNHDQFLLAGKQAIDRNPNIKLGIVGEGPLRRQLESMSQSLGIADRIVFTGWVQPIFPILSAMHSMVMCSKSEGFGLTLLEAMQCGVPVIASRVSQVSEIVKDEETGILVEPNSVNELANAMVRFASDSDLHAKCSSHGPVHVRQMFPIEDEVQTTADVYQRLMNR